MKLFEESLGSYALLLRAICTVTVLLLLAREYHLSLKRSGMGNEALPLPVRPQLKFQSVRSMKHRLEGLDNPFNAFGTFDATVERRTT